MKKIHFNAQLFSAMTGIRRNVINTMLSRTVFLLASLLFAGAPMFLAGQSVGANSYFGGNGRLVFYSPNTLDSTEQEIYTIKPDGTELQQITNNSLADANPQWAPSGDKIAFDRYVSGGQQQDIYIQNINPDGSANGSATVLSGANTPQREFDPSWSPDGTKIAFHRCELDVNDECVGAYQIYIIDSSGGTPVRVTTDGNTQDTEPTWRKDGAYLTFKHGNGVSIASATSPFTVTSVDAAGGSPQWSPTDNKVVYVKSGQLWVYDQDQSQTEQLTSGASGISAPTWSPDGKLIATSNGGVLSYYDAVTGDLVKSVTLASSGDFVASNNANELDWARAAQPENTTHECTTYVNEDCTEFTPEIPAECQSVITSAAHGTPKYEEGAFVFTPADSYVGEDTYVYQYYDSGMNAITCTVNITVLPRAPDTGSTSNTHIISYGLAGVGTLVVGAYLLRKKVFNK